MTREFKKCGNINIPLNWEYRPIKTIIRGISDGTHGTFERVRDGYPLLSAKNVFDDGIHIGDNESQISEEAFNEITANGYPHKDDILLCCVGTIGRSTIYPYEKPMAFQRSVIFLTLNQNLMLPEMMHYLLMSDDVKAQENNLINQSAQAGLYQGSVKQIRVVVPPLTEQKEIIRFLNSSCHRIDNAISLHQQIIEKLEEYRKSVITQAVTKGLDPNAEMKNTGNQWIPEVPCIWNVVQMKYVLLSGKEGLKIGPFGSALKGKTLADGPYKIYNQAHLISGDFTLNRHFVSAETFEELQNYEVKPGDILFSMMGTIGKCRIMPTGFQRGLMDSHLLKGRLNHLIDPEYLLYVYDKDNSSLVINQLLKLSTGSIMNGLNSSILKNIVIPLPPIDVQKQIVAKLNEHTHTIDMAIAQHQLLIEKLREYKQSLIYNAVTGKIDRREVE